MKHPQRRKEESKKGLNRVSGALPHPPPSPTDHPVDSLTAREPPCPEGPAPLLVCGWAPLPLTNWGVTSLALQEILVNIFHQ